MTAIRVLIADDHALFREGIRALLMTTADITCVGEAASGQEALEQIEELHPDVVLMDINMPGLTGVEATERILALRPQTAILMVTMLEDDTSVYGALRAGARGYILKGANHEDLLEAIRAAAQGKALYSGQIASRITGFFQNSDHVGVTASFPELTEREREVLDLIARGRSNSDIAEALVISPNTVRNHITSIFDKLGVSDRAEAIVKAREAGHGKG